jgi:hypothetical protein
VDVHELSEHGLGTPVLEVGWASWGKEVRPRETMLLTITTSRWSLWVCGCKTPRSGEMFIERRIPLNFIARSEMLSISLLATNLKGLAVL